MENSTKVVTGKVRFSYVNAFTAVAPLGEGTPKYSVCLIIPKSDTTTIEKIKKAIEVAKQAGKAKLADKNGRIPSNVKSPLRDGDVDRPDDPVFADAYFINANSLRKPGVVDASLNHIIDPDEFYSGCYGRASINFYAYNTAGQKGIAAGLNNLQKLADGESLMGGSSAESDFGDSSDDNGDMPDWL